MKYFSELLNETFETEKECLEAEKNYKIQKEVEAKKEATRLANISKRKKELSKAIDEAETSVDEANKLYEIAKEKAKEILEKSNKEVKEILSAAEVQVKQANEKRLNAILDFNKEFGAYKVSYSGDKAITEFNKSMDTLDNYFKKFLNFWF